MQHVIHLLQV